MPACNQHPGYQGQVEAQRKEQAPNADRHFKTVTKAGHGEKKSLGQVTQGLHPFFLILGGAGNPWENPRASQGKSPSLQAGFLTPGSL